MFSSILTTEKDEPFRVRITAGSDRLVYEGKSILIILQGSNLFNLSLIGPVCRFLPGRKSEFIIYLNNCVTPDEQPQASLVHSLIRLVHDVNDGAVA